MGQKTVLKRIARFLPLSVRKAAALDDLYESGRHAALDDLGELVVDLPAEMETPRPEPPPAPRTREVPAAEPEGIELSEEELFALLPPLHILEILDAVAEREMPEEALEPIIGRPLDEVTEEDTPEILRAIGLWQPE